LEQEVSWDPDTTAAQLGPRNRKWKSGRTKHNSCRSARIQIHQLVGPMPEVSEETFNIL
jgi:hypothetical protein